jgi:hypothetical protein
LSTATGKIWEIPKGYCIASGLFLKGLGKPMGYTKITLISAGQMFLLAGCDAKSGKCYKLIADKE